MHPKTHYSEGELIVEEGSQGDCAFLIHRGIVEVSVRRGDRRIVLAILSDGDVFGEMGLIACEPRTADVRALAPTQVGIICRTFFEQQLLKTDPLIDLFLRLLLKRFHENRNRLLALPPACLDGMRLPFEQEGEPLSCQGDMLRRFNFISDLLGALEKGQMRIYFQPILNLADGRLAGFEALVRWQHPVRGLLSPQEFIPVAEDTREIMPLGVWIFENACKVLRDMHDLGGAALWMSINVSPVQLQEPALARQFEEVLEAAGVPARSVKIELTENLLVNDLHSTVRFLGDAKRLGLSIAIDDFGTGYSSLSYLHCFPVDVLKIDRSFVAKMGTDYRSREIVQAIVALSKNLDIDVVAEGVETEEAQTLLRQLGCRYAQGYFYSTPVEAGQALQMAAQAAGRAG